MEQFNPAAIEDMTGIFDFPDKNRGVLGALRPTVISQSHILGYHLSNPTSRSQCHYYLGLISLQVEETQL